MQDRPEQRATREFLDRLDRSALAAPTGPLAHEATRDLRVWLGRLDRRAIPAPKAR